MKSENFETLICEVESIIACVENVNELNTDIDLSEIRFAAEELGSFVCNFYEDSDEFTKDADAEEISINLYQSVKYTLEDLEESITDPEVLVQFEYIRTAVDEIRELFF